MRRTTKYASTLLFVPAALLAVGACAGPADRQFMNQGTPLAPDDNRFVNQVQHELGRSLDDTSGTAAGMIGSLTCTVGPGPAQSALQAAVGPADQREIIDTAVRLATPNSPYCQGKMAQDRARQADADRAKAAGEARVAERNRQAAQQHQRTSTSHSGTSSGSESGSSGSGSRGSQSGSGSSNGGSTSDGGAGSESTRQYQQWYGPNGPGNHGQLPGKITPECDATCARGN